MYNNQTTFFILLILNITLGSNGWGFFGINIGAILFYIMSIICILHNIKTKYAITTLILTALVFLFKIFSLTGNSIFSNFADFFSAFIFIIFGSFAFGTNLNIIYKNLLKLILISIPIMYIQIVGIHTFFYAWNVELFHENHIYSFDEIKDLGKIFKDIPLFPTLFVDLDDLIIPMYQSRPTGLFHSNNVFSIFICTLVGLHFSIDKKYLSKLSYFVVSFAVVFSGSLLAISVYLILSIYFLFKSKDLRKRNFVSFYYFLFALLLKFLLFPGILLNSIHSTVIIGKFASRFLIIINELGFNGAEFFYNLSDGVDYSNNKFADFEASSSKLIYLLDIRFTSLLFFILLFLYFKFKKKLRIYKEIYIKKNMLSYYTLFFIILLTQIAVPFYASPFFQIILGASMAPFIIKKLN